MNGQPEHGAAQDVILRERAWLTITGVEDVTAFDEDSVTLRTAKGILSVDGSMLKITRLSVETGELEIEGRIGGVLYLDEEPPKKKRSIFGR